MHSSKDVVLLSEKVQSSLQHDIRPFLDHTALFQHSRFLHNTQCVIDMQYYCQYVQWSMHIAAVFETKQLC